MSIIIYLVLAILLGVLGVKGIRSKRLIISRKQELSGIPASFLSVLYVLVAIIGLIIFFGNPDFIFRGFPLLAIVTGIMTIIFILLFRKSRSN